MGASLNDLEEASGKYILLVDDTYFNLFALKLCLQHMGHRVETAQSGQEAIDHCEDKIFDLILLDIQMPDMDGPEVLEKIRTKYPHYNKIPVAAVTAEDPEIAEQIAEQCGMFYALPKPHTVEQLQECIAATDTWVPMDTQS